MNDFATAARAIFVPEVLAIVVPCAVVIYAALRAEAADRRQR